jgi:hypothetical protein
MFSIGRFDARMEAVVLVVEKKAKPEKKEK